MNMLDCFVEQNSCNLIWMDPDDLSSPAPFPFGAIGYYSLTESLSGSLSVPPKKDGLMVKCAKEAVNEHFHIKEFILCACHDQEWKELGRLFQGARCPISTFWSILEQITPSFPI